MNIYHPDNLTDRALALAIEFDWDQMGPVLANLVLRQNGTDDRPLPDRTPITHAERIAAYDLARSTRKEPENEDLWPLCDEILSFNTNWKPWKLADDAETYGKDAGKFILVSPDGETEHPNGKIYDTEEEARAEASQ
jgi:hypothetical protein